MRDFDGAKGGSIVGERSRRRLLPMIRKTLKDEFVELPMEALGGGKAVHPAIGIWPADEE